MRDVGSGQACLNMFLRLGREQAMWLGRMREGGRGGEARGWAARRTSPGGNDICISGSGDEPALIYGNPLDANSIFERTHEPIPFLGEVHWLLYVHA